MKEYGIVVGKFYPLHIGHVNLIQRASTLCKKVIVIVSHHEARDQALYLDSNLKRPLTGKDKLAIVQKTFQNQRDLIIPILVDESDVPSYPNGWQPWSDLVKESIANHRKVPKDFSFDKAVFFINEDSDVEGYKKYFGSDVVLLDQNRSEVNISATKVRNDPYKYWDFIPRASRELLVPKIVIAGGESSGKTIMTDRLSQLYATTSVWEYGRTITETELGGDESALQYKHYADIVSGHYQDLKFAATNANKVLFSDTDFVATQAFCMTYEGRQHPSVQDKIENVRFDLTILLNNNVEWVDDGMRMIGEETERQKFQALLKSLYIVNNIPFVEISASDYEVRYEVCKMVVKEFLENKVTVEELQKKVNEMESDWEWK